MKTFSLSAIVAYLGIALSAFVYVPFGEEVMASVQYYLFHGDTPLRTTAKTWLSSVFTALPANITSSFNGTADAKGAAGASTRTFWERDSGSARGKLSSTRLQDQMFAFTVTNQVINTFLEIGLPFVLRAVASVRSGRGLSLAAPAAGANGGNGNGKKKRVMFEDQTAEADGERLAELEEEREFLDRINREVALPDYDLFADYSEMVTQFGYVALWSTIWPLAPGKPIQLQCSSRRSWWSGCSHVSRKQLARAAVRRVQDHRARPATNSYAHRHDWPVARHAYVPDMARGAHEFCARLPLPAARPLQAGRHVAVPCTPPP